jgi:signal transduction histidine kinase/CheY-like chemotaxis protein
MGISCRPGAHELARKMTGFSALTNWISRLSFRSKMGLATIAACAATALIACIAFMINESVTYRMRFDREQQTLSAVLAANVTASVLFADDASATDILRAIYLTPQVDGVVVKTPDGGVFASVVQPKMSSGEDIGAYLASHRGPRYESTIRFDDETVGQLILLTNLGELEHTIWRYGFIATLVFLGSTVFAIFLARWESQAMATPMLQLRQTIQSIRETRDYSSRVKGSLDRDFGRLIDNFNAMLEEIESRDERLESLVGDLITARDAAQLANTAKSQFLANMSHELRTPLNAIINYAEIIQEDLDSGETDSVVGDVGKIQSAGVHLLGLINGILDLSKIEAGKMELEAHTFDLTTVIREATDTVRPAAERNGNRLDVSIDGSIGLATTDSFKFRQCILNLLSNACKFTNNGVVSLDAAIISDTGRDFVRVAIRDTGIGMDEKQIASLFQPFVQADASTTRKYGGTGLGLAITHRLVNLMGGRIEVTSAPGVGSVFTFYIPRVFVEQEADRAASKKSPEQAGAVGTGKRTALIVDDDPSACDLMSRLAARLGYATVCAENGAAALAMAAKNTPDVIILDLHMPVMDGWTLLEKLRADQKLRSIPTIVVSVDDDARECYRLGAEDYFTKPLNRIELERALLSYTRVASGKILVVEDNDDAADLIMRAARNVGFDAIRATDGEQGLSALAKDAVVGVILDLGLPGMDGFEFLDALRASSKWRDMPVIVFSAQELAPEQIQIIEEKAQGYKVKTEASPRSVIAEMMVKSGVMPTETNIKSEGERKCAS